MIQISLYTKVYIFSIIIKLHGVSGCLNTQLNYEKIMITGDELNHFLSPEAFKVYNYDRSLKPENLNLKNKRAYAHFDFLNILIYIPQEKILYDPFIREKMRKIFFSAIGHLRFYFMGEFYTIDMARKILICCIEYGIRRDNEKYINLNEDVHCKKILGIGFEKLETFYFAQSYSNADIFHIIF